MSNVCSPCDSSNTNFDNDADIANENEPAQVHVPNSADVQPPAIWQIHQQQKMSGIYSAKMLPIQSAP